ncbi:hypothetical protein SUGI_0638620 [Cryptomeria japonica]|nr:hypothetical protein SUGI_0638620 [Cryptomeria japonica]
MPFAQPVPFAVLPSTDSVLQFAAIDGVLSPSTADPGAMVTASAARVGFGVKVNASAARVGYGATVSTVASFGGQIRVPRAHFQQGLKRLNVDRGFIPISNAISIKLKAETKEEIDYNAFIFSTQGFICRFRGFWLSLPQLHSWILEHWESLITGKVHI